MDDSKAFSVIQLFRHFQSAVDRIDVYPLVKSNIKVQSDIYSELSNERYCDEPFARLDKGFSESNKDYTFCCDFYGHGVGLYMKNQDCYFLGYDSVSISEKDLATRLVQILQALTNGQLFILETYTEDDGYTRVAELVYKGPGDMGYEAIHTFTSYEKNQKYEQPEYSTRYLRNDIDLQEVDLDIELLRKFLPPTEGVLNRGAINSLRDPFTYELWQQLFEQDVERKRRNQERKIEAWFEKRLEKINTYAARLEAKSKKQDQDWKKRYVDSMKKRHLELVWWCVFATSVMVYFLHAEPTVYAYISVIYCAMAAALVTAFRNIAYKKYLFLATPLSYVAVAVAYAVCFGAERNVAFWMLLTATSISLIECLYFDVRGIMKSRVRVTT